MMSRKQWRRDEIVEIAVTSLTYEGRGVGRADGLALFVRGALPGDQARVRLTKVKRSYAEAEVIEILAPSPLRVTARCRHFGVCGGCASQDLAYTAQVDNKALQIRESLRHLGGLEADVRPALTMPEPWRYRNKMEFAFGTREGRLCLGLMQRGSYHEVTPIAECFLTTERAMQAVRAVEAFGRRRGWVAFDPRARTGSLRHLVIREALHTGDLMLNVVSRSDTAPDAGLVAALKDVQPTTLLWSHNDTFGSVVRGDAVTILAGADEIRERIGHLEIVVGPFSFLQTNSDMVDALYAEVERQAALTGSETVLDLYCGAGAIGLYLARRARRIVGVDNVAEAIAFAGRNAAQNSITNAEFQCAEVEALSTLSLGAIAPDVVIVDPPRTGLHPRLIKNLRDLVPARIVYVSCNPAALARDLKALSDLYTLGSVQPVDMFPHTWHVEAVVALRRA